MPRLIAEGFNEVLYEGENKGGSACDFPSIIGFRDVIEYCWVKDLVFSGYMYTWSNKKGEIFVDERLDKALANDAGMDLFPSFAVHNVVWE